MTTPARELLCDAQAVNRAVRTNQVSSSPREDVAAETIGDFVALW